MRCTTPNRRVFPTRIVLTSTSLVVLVLGGASGCLSDLDRPVEPTCGNGTLDPDEACDATLLAGCTCSDRFWAPQSNGAPQ